MHSSKLVTSLIALTCVASGGAFAADRPALTRAQIQADFVGARAAGRLPVFSEQGTPVDPTPSTRGRAAVQAEYQAARAAGALPVLSEMGLPLEGAPSTKSRAAVQAEYFQAQKNGTLLTTHDF